MKIIALEEHFILPKEEQNLPPGAHRGNDREKLLGFDVVAELLNLGDTRLAAMDAAGIDVQVLSHNQPGCQALDATSAMPMAREATICCSKPSRRIPSLRRPRRPADGGPCGRGEGARPRGYQARLQGRNDQRSHPGQLPRRQEVLVHLRVRAVAAGAGLSASEQAAPRGDEGLFRGLRGAWRSRPGASASTPARIFSGSSSPACSMPSPI